MGTAVMLWTEFVEKVQSYRRDLIVAKTELNNRLGWQMHDIDVYTV